MNRLKLRKVPVGEEIKSLKIEVQYNLCALARWVGPQDNVEEEFLWGDSRAIREAFESVGDEREMLTFLKDCGPFNPVGRVVTWEIFQKWQRYFRAQRLGEPVGMRTKVGSTPEGFGDNERLKILVGRPDIKIIRKEPYSKSVELKAWIECECALEAIAAANFVDKLAGKEPRKCLECRRVFEPPTKRRRYCSQKCTDKACRAGKRLDSHGRQIKSRGRTIASESGKA